MAISQILISGKRLNFLERGGMQYTCLVRCDILFFPSLQPPYLSRQKKKNAETWELCNAQFVRRKCKDLRNRLFLTMRYWDRQTQRSHYLLNAFPHVFYL